jgi:hypothetical protein
MTVEAKKEEITFELYEKEHNVDVTEYRLGIKINGKVTPFMAEVESGYGNVKGRITLCFDDFDTVEDWKVDVKGDIRHFKKMVIEDWDKIKEWGKTILIGLIFELDEVMKIYPEEEIKWK